MIAACDAAGFSVLSGNGPTTRATPSVSSSTATSPSRLWRSCGPSSSAVRISGPLVPGPKPSVVSSYAWKVVVSSGKLLSSLNPRRRLSTGIVMTSSSTVTPIAIAQELRWTTRLHRYDHVSRTGTSRRRGTSVRSGAMANEARSTTTASGAPISSGWMPRPTPSSAIDTSPAAISPRRRVDLDPRAGEAEEGRQQRDRGDHRHEHGDRCAGGEAVDEGEAHDEHAEQRDDHRESGEHDGAAGGVERDHCRLLRTVAGSEPFSIAGDDEQGVVDADAEADHRAERDREVGHRHHVGQQGDDPRAERHAEQRHADRQAHREHRTEGDDQDDDREREADQFRLRRLELAEGLTTDLDLEPVDLGRRHRLAASGVRQFGFGQRFDLAPDLLRAHLADRLVEVEAGVGDQAGRVSLGCDEPALLALHAVGAGHVDAVDGIDLVEQCGHRRLHLGVVDALIGLEHDGAGDAAAEPAEVLVERVEAVLRLRVGDREGAARFGADRADRAEHDDQHGEPGPEHDPAATEAEPSEPLPERRIGRSGHSIHCWTV